MKRPRDLPEFPVIVWVNLATIPGYRVPPLIADKVKT